MTAAALKAYTVGLSALITIKVLAPAFYAHQDIKTPVKIATVALCCTQLSNVICVHLLQHAGLALSISIGAWVNAGGLIYFLLKTRLFIPQPHWSIFTIKLILANVVLILVLLLCRHQVNSALLASWTTQLCALNIVIALATLSYLITLYLLLKA
jgi:putative peptidoglycan lipid II flippase